MKSVHIHYQIYLCERNTQNEMGQSICSFNVYFHVETDELHQRPFYVNQSPNLMLPKLELCLNHVKNKLNASRYTLTNVTIFKLRLLSDDRVNGIYYVLIKSVAKYSINNQSHFRFWAK